MTYSTTTVLRTRIRSNFKELGSVHRIPRILLESLLLYLYLYMLYSFTSFIHIHRTARRCFRSAPSRHSGPQHHGGGDHPTGHYSIPLFHTPPSPPPPYPTHHSTFRNLLLIIPCITAAGHPPRRHPRHPCRRPSSTPACRAWTATRSRCWRCTPSVPAPPPTPERRRAQCTRCPSCALRGRGWSSRATAAGRRGARSPCRASCRRAHAPTSSDSQ